MLRVKTKIGPSGVHGTGLFADQFIPKGTITWQYDAKLDTSYSKETVDSLDDLRRGFFLFYCYYDKNLDKLILCSDNQRFINHSTKNANVISTPNSDTAARDIQIGEELLSDYKQFDDSYFDRLGIHEDNLVD